LKKSRLILIALIIGASLAVSTLTGCINKTATTTTTPTRKFEIVKVMDITDSAGVKWKKYNLRLTLEGGATFTVDLNLVNGDNVDALYITEKPTSGASVDFKVKAGGAVIYTSTPSGAAVVGNTTDRLNFTASTANGTSYRFVFHNNLTDKNSKETIYTEITYPAKDAGEDSIFIPLETN
jgi:hypothetical protein